MRRLISVIWVFLTPIIFAAVAGVTAATSTQTNAAEFTVYSVYQALDLGNPGEKPQKDFYVNMGQAQGVREGTVLEVLRRSSTYDTLSEKLYKDVTFPIARLKVIHVEQSAAIARMDKMLPVEKTPALTPRAVMVGDLVQISHPGD